MGKPSIDRSPAATGRRREAVASALGSNAIESHYFGPEEMDIVHRYIDGEMDGDTMREQLLALPLDGPLPQLPTPPTTQISPRVPGAPDSQIEKMLATLNSYTREDGK